MTAIVPKLELPSCSHKPRPYTGPSRDEIIAMRKQFTNPAIFTLYRDPLLIVEGFMQYLYDETGRRYLDFFGGIVFATVIPRDVAAAEAPSHGRCVMDYAPRSRAALAYIEL